MSGVVYKYKGKMPERPADSDAVEAEVFLSSGVSDHPADICLVLEQLPIVTPEAAARFGAPPQDGFTIAPALIHPSSRGRVRLTSADWHDLVEFARTAAASFGHPAGTARMGTDAAAVVDPSLRVRNVRGLRVADASVMPTVPAGGGTHAPSVMIGGRAALMIQADRGASA